MRISKSNPIDAVAGILRDYLTRHSVLHVDGVGDLRINGGGNRAFQFEPESGSSVFIGYASEDRRHVHRLSRQLRAAGMRPWVDQEQLLPGQNWPRAIERAIESADFAIQCFSPNSVGRRGYFHKELRLVLDCATRVPLEDVFFLPIRLAECAIPARVSSQFQYVDMFPDWNDGLESLIDVIGKANKSCDTT